MRAILCLSAVVSASLASGQVTNRLPSRIQGHEWFTLSGNVRPVIASAHDEGLLPPSFAVPRMSIRFKMTPVQDAELTQLLANQQTPGSTGFHRWLTPEQYADRFGMTQADARTIADWLESFGFSEIDPAPSRTSISFSGNAAQVEAAFRTRLHAYLVNGETHFANAGDPVLPKELEGAIESISGLHDFRAKAQHVRRSATASRPNFTAGGEHSLTPDDFATIYNVKPLYAAGIDGTGEKIAVVGQSDININDIRAFRSAAALPRKDPIVVLAGPDPGTDADTETEADLDIEWAGGIARNATIIYVNSVDAIGSAEYAIEHNLAPVISISYGACEADIGSADLTSLSNLFRQANAQGITVLASSGDLGAAGCEAKDATVATHGLAVIAPASIPYVTSVGGTAIFNNIEWGATNNRAGGSALGYMLETAWNDTAEVGHLEASGGGKSAFFTKPVWQAGPGVPNDGARDVPDIAFTASPQDDGYLICSAGSCANGFWSSTGILDIVGGTSASAPAMAGIVALLDQAYGAPQGNINPELYALASFAQYTFHDIFPGANTVPCTVGTPDCTTGSEGYESGDSQYNQVTGLGSIDAVNLVGGWGESAPAAVLSPPGLRALVAGADGSLWSIDEQEHAVRYSQQTQSWTEISNLQITYLYVGSSTAMWAVDDFGNVYRWDPVSGTFELVPGNFWSVSVAADGDAWAIQAPPSAIFHFNASSKSWVPIPGQLSQIAVGSDGVVWGLNNYQQIYRFNPATGLFEYVPGSLASIYVGSDGGVWGINGSESTYHFNPLHQSWDGFGGSMANLSVGSNTNVWAWTSNYLPYKFSSLLEDWYSPYQLAYSVLASADGAAWANIEGEYVQLSPPMRTLNSWHEIPGQLVQLAAASDGNVWGINMFGQIYAFDSLKQQWTSIPGKLAQIAVARDGAVWGINPEGSVYRYDYATLNWDLMPGALTQVLPADNGDVWGINAQGSVYRFDAAAGDWITVAASFAQLSVGADGASWSIDSQSHVYRFDPSSGSFVLQPGLMAQISVGSSGNVWALDADGLIYRFDSSNQVWQSIPGQLAQIRVAFDGAVWGINSQQEIWRYNASTGSWDNIPGALTSLSLGSDAVIWGLNAEGATYYFE